MAESKALPQIRDLKQQFGKNLLLVAIVRAFQSGIITVQTINDLLQTRFPLFEELRTAYDLLPPTRCRRKTQCCSLLPEMTLIEALAALHQIKSFPPPLRLQITQKLVRYFFLNAAEISACPFLQGDACRIYADRFFGCRAYGLWSAAHYETIAAGSRQAKKNLQHQWQTLGVTLPPDVTDYCVPYCPDVHVVGEEKINDAILLKTADRIESLSGNLDRWHQSFQTTYFKDLSFLAASLLLGVTQAVRLKFTVVRDRLTTGSRRDLKRIIEEVADIWPD
jgi:Fe-S-cluster containining protein